MSNSDKSQLQTRSIYIKCIRAVLTCCSTSTYLFFFFVFIYFSSTISQYGCHPRNRNGTFKNIGFSCFFFFTKDARFAKNGTGVLKLHAFLNLRRRPVFFLLLIKYKRVKNSIITNRAIKKS